MTWIHLLVPRQTLRVLLITYLPHPQVLNPYSSVVCPSKHQQKLSHPPQVLPYSRKLIQIFKNPWVSLDPPLVLFFWTHPLRDLELPHMSRKWKLNMDQHFLHVSALILRMCRIRILMHPRSFLRRSRIDLNNTLTKGMRLNRGLPRINSMMNPMNLGFHLLNSKKHADKSRHKVRSRYVSSSSDQRRISPLQPDIGLQSPLGFSPLGLSLTKTNLNMIQTPLIIGK